ncbi:MAG: UvrD-helicase domain-containing protein [Acidobacteria bacterium]|nr:UvrD-helicase domain-containing protein [Acidobacteriota bacterium]
MQDLDLRDPRLLDRSLVVSASAGSGKTFTITVVVLAQLGRGDLRPHEVLATTFSEAAAADLRERLRRPLNLLASLDAAAWDAVLGPLRAGDGAGVEAALEGLSLPGELPKAAREVGAATPHWPGQPWTSSPSGAQAFWRRVRREAELMAVSTIHSLARRVLGRGEGAPGTLLDVAHPSLLRLLRQSLRETLDLPPEHPDHDGARLLLAWAERNWEELSRAHDQHLDAQGHFDPEDPAPHRERLRAALEAAARALAPFVADPLRALDASSSSRRYFKPSCIQALPSPGAGLAEQLAWAEAQSRAVKPENQYFSDTFREAMATFTPAAEALEAWLRCLLVGGLRAFEERKRQLGLATFGDLVRQALVALQGGGMELQAPRLLLVDEYQDTSRSQDAFLSALGAERVVRVGDVKQAIYGFRGGDPALLRDHLQAAGEGAFRLPANFRSTPDIVALANGFVEELWPRLSPGVGDLGGSQQARAPKGTRVGLVRSAAPQSRADLPALTEWIAALSEDSGWARSLGEASGRAPRRRALLLKQRTRLPILLQRLKARGIQPYVVARDGFWDSPGVRLMMAALEAVAHPERPLPCAALLRQVAGMRDEDLTRLALGTGGRAALPGLGRLDPDALPEGARDAGRWLQSLLHANTLELAGRLLRQGALLRSLRALAVHGAMEPLRARRNLAAFLAMLLELPASPSVAFTRLQDERAGLVRGDLPAAPDEADLLIQTVHGSKGLEFEDVILPLLHSHPRSFGKGGLRTEAATGRLRLAWKLGEHPGADYEELKPLAEARQREDDLNLFYVALTRARERLCLLLQEPKEAKPAEGSRTWAQWGQHLAAAPLELRILETPPPPGDRPGRAARPPVAPPLREGLPETESVQDPHEGLPPEARAKARQEGEAVHAYLRQLLVRWEEPASFTACLDAAPPVPRARENALRFLEQFEARGWRLLRRRTEFPLEGAAASGALGRADLVVWEKGRVHLLDFKHSRAFGDEELAGYRAQLARYASALSSKERLPVDAWLVALRSGDWVPVPLVPPGPAGPTP